jgi:hypothetical protein
MPFNYWNTFYTLRKRASLRRAFQGQIFILRGETKEETHSWKQKLMLIKSGVDSMGRRFGRKDFGQFFFRKFAPTSAIKIFLTILDLTN